YMDNRGGRMLILFDVVTDRKMTSMVKTGLEKLLERYDVDVTDQVLFSFPPAGGVSRLVSVLGTEAGTAPTSANIVARKFRGQPMPVFTARIVRPLKKSGQFKAEELLLGVAQDEKQVIWGESRMDSLKDPGRFAFTHKRFHEAVPYLSLGVAV